jgi:hypothetical protein
MAVGDHECAVPKCTTPARAAQLMCYAHWKALPKKIQRDVNFTWSRYRQDPEAYREAREAAIDAAVKAGKPQGLLL